ncbi:MAG: hypothetical protein CL424_02660 [Acidimicrobiaceae bacterium]|nr:hypothetical protein [Acidimicrobiaceae bacterium]
MIPRSSPPLDDFLAGAEPSTSAEALQRVGVVLGVAGALVTLGVMVFLRFIWSAEVGSRRRLEAAIVVGGAVTLVGSILQAMGTATILDDGLLDVVSGTGGAGVMMRALGGAFVVLGLADRFAADGNVADTGATDTSTSDTWRPPPTAFFAIAGAALSGLSFAFDGHTVSRGPRVVHAMTDAVHVGAGAVWVGGLSALALLALARPGSARVSWTMLLHRYSTFATAALVVVAAAGAVMAVFVLDSWGDLFRTEWGQVLIVKTLLVALAAAVGAYQHFVIVPRLPDVAERRARTAVLVETSVLLSVVVATGLLTTASTV